MGKISGIDTLDENSEKRTQAYQQYYEYMNNQQAKQNNGAAAAKTTDESRADSADRISSVVDQSSDGDTYQKSMAVTGSGYDTNGKRQTMDFSAYTKTKFIAASPPDVTAEMSEQLFTSLDDDNDHLLETDEFSKSANGSKKAPEAKADSSH